MFINYVAVMVVNLAISFVLLAFFVYLGLVRERANWRRWAPAFAVAGFVHLVTGLHMIFNWPLPGSANLMFGENSVLFGTLLLGASWAMYMGQGLYPLTIVGVVAGINAVVVGARILNLNLTQQPFLSALGFIASGLGGVVSPIVYRWRDNRLIRILGALLVLGAGVLWAATAYTTTWGHIEDYAGWRPTALLERLPPQ